MEAQALIGGKAEGDNECSAKDHNDLALLSVLGSHALSSFSLGSADARLHPALRVLSRIVDRMKNLEDYWFPLRPERILWKGPLPVYIPTRKVDAAALHSNPPRPDCQHASEWEAPPRPDHCQHASEWEAGSQWIRASSVKDIELAPVGNDVPAPQVGDAVVWFRNLHQSVSIECTDSEAVVLHLGLTPQESGFEAVTFLADADGNTAHTEVLPLCLWGHVTAVSYDAPRTVDINAAVAEAEDVGAPVLPTEYKSPVAVVTVAIDCPECCVVWEDVPNGPGQEGFSATRPASVPRTRQSVDREQPASDPAAASGTAKSRVRGIRGKPTAEAKAKVRRSLRAITVTVQLAPDEIVVDAVRVANSILSAPFMQGKEGGGGSRVHPRWGDIKHWDHPAFEVERNGILGAPLETAELQPVCPPSGAVRAPSSPCPATSAATPKRSRDTASAIRPTPLKRSRACSSVTDSASVDSIVILTDSDSDAPPVRAEKIKPAAVPTPIESPPPAFSTPPHRGQSAARANAAATPQRPVSCKHCKGVRQWRCFSAPPSGDMTLPCVHSPRCVLTLCPVEDAAASSPRDDVKAQGLAAIGKRFTHIATAPDFLRHLPLLNSAGGASACAASELENASSLKEAASCFSCRTLLPPRTLAFSCRAHNTHVCCSCAALRQSSATSPLGGLSATPSRGINSPFKISRPFAAGLLHDASVDYSRCQDSSKLDPKLGHRALNFLSRCRITGFLNLRDPLSISLATGVQQLYRYHTLRCNEELPADAPLYKHPALGKLKCGNMFPIRFNLLGEPLALRELPATGVIVGIAPWDCIDENPRHKQCPIESRPPALATRFLTPIVDADRLAWSKILTSAVERYPHFADPPSYDALVRAIRRINSHPSQMSLPVKRSDGDLPSWVEEHLPLALSDAGQWTEWSVLSCSVSFILKRLLSDYYRSSASVHSDFLCMLFSFVRCAQSFFRDAIGTHGFNEDRAPAVLWGAKVLDQLSAFDSYVTNEALAAGLTLMLPDPTAAHPMDIPADCGGLGPPKATAHAIQFLRATSSVSTTSGEGDQARS